MYLLNPREVTFTLSEALDFVGIDDTLHGKRVAYMAAKVGETLGWPKQRIDDIIYTGMLHDCGVSSTIVHSHLINELDWDNSYLHAERGFELMKSVRLFQDYALAVRFHHTHWQNLPSDLSQATQIDANLIYLVDRVDALRAKNQDSFMDMRAHIFKVLQSLSGSFFSPELVDKFIETAGNDAFWYFLEEQSLRRFFADWIAEQSPVEFSFDEVKEFSLLFSAAVDAKSPFTSEHSIGVACLARYLAELLGLTQVEQEHLELAGLFHDLGKLKVKDRVLNKPGQLDVDERIEMNRHGFDSNVILTQITGFKDIAFLASLHHETLDGQGYPYHLKGEQIPFNARILAVADIFQALVQNRPYRNALSAETAFEILNNLKEQGKLDAKVCDVLHDNLEVCYQKAMVAYTIDNQLAVEV
ncbi:HD domain-containing phosphohydrolase [Thiosulfativibrio zosterae]|uniref:Phosphodiesterase n=1 Tax=Thiosulfativibrio zosterae TaxID=2675053 RepID=A0A6F8PPP3_9GAMM|nr:HD domain-containing phosphohydrolase [Thiosulfativibrio zosterae]BBP44083.1 phosphodiesterase [Thiosulfativibrio zosterae]